MSAAALPTNASPSKWLGLVAIGALIMLVGMGSRMSFSTAGRVDLSTQVGSGGGGESDLLADLIAAERATDWTRAGVTGGIVNRTTICDTLTSSATITNINDALDACPDDQVVLLSAGTYNLGSGVINLEPRVTLRGEGADATKLIFTDRGGCANSGGVVCFPGQNIPTWGGGGPQNVANWTAGYSKGTTVITLASVTNLAVGDLIILDQLDDASDGGEIYVCQGAATCSYTGFGGDGRDGRLQAVITVVAGISGNDVTLRDPLDMPNWRSDRDPEAMWSGIRSTGLMGLEDLSIDCSACPGGGSSGLIETDGTKDGWIKGVRAINNARSWLNVYQSTHFSAVDSYFFGCGSCVSVNYGIEIYSQSSYVLFQNNIVQRNPAMVNMNEGGMGHVIAYNFLINGYRGDVETIQTAGIWIHSPGVGMPLIEGNSATGVNFDDWYGTSHFATVFRNHFYGDICQDYLTSTQCGGDKTSNLFNIGAFAYQRLTNLIGNVLGSTDVQDTYEPAGAIGCGSGYVFCFGETFANGGLATDEETKPTALRWGNYDVVNDAVRWESSEIPTGLTDYPFAVPDDQLLPDSFYLDAKPDWFGSIAFPPVGPDVTGGIGGVTDPDSHAHKIPARVCWESLAADEAGFGAGTEIKIFDRAACYE